ncbi:hypothetical protein [Pseudonocardia broussonetiae]|uniref:Tail assembly chaperone n=1 Tax=Pseudonocardia broussonetiae TaxID=2736640 RepID=A0A6M6JUS4_9PSEU|nr:hypothetical protein [Pseudonocardia broussonetiae]QJY51250.1 hypothetical protein HOP40_35305 [Pseudonocardia broussonetiae]
MSTENTGYAQFDDLLTPVADVTEDVDLGNGRRVKVRGLTRYELILSGKGTDDATLVERRNLSTCLVEPKLTLAQAERWQKASTPDVIAKVTNAIRRLSGLAEGAAKSDVPGDGDDGS